MVPEKGTADSMPRVSAGGAAVDKPKNRMLKCPSNLIFCDQRRGSREALSAGAVFPERHVC